MKSCKITLLLTIALFLFLVCGYLFQNKSKNKNECLDLFHETFHMNEELWKRSDIFNLLDDELIIGPYSIDDCNVQIQPFFTKTIFAQEKGHGSWTLERRKI